MEYLIKDNCKGLNEIKTYAQNKRIKFDFHEVFGRSLLVPKYCAKNPTSKPEIIFWQIHDKIRTLTKSYCVILPGVVMNPLIEQKYIQNLSKKFTSLKFNIDDGVHSKWRMVHIQGKAMEVSIFYSFRFLKFYADHCLYY